MRSILLLAWLLSSFRATAMEDEFTGLWLNPSEPGWGISVHQQGSRMLVTVLGYGADGQPEWSFANLDMTNNDYMSTAFEGDLVVPAKPAKGAVLSAGTGRRVGKFRFEMDWGQDEAHFILDDRTLSSRFTRYVWAPKDLTGVYEGVRSGLMCGAAKATSRVRLEVVQHDEDVVMQWMTPETGRCEIRGQARSDGVGANLYGSIACTESRLAGHAYLAPIRVDRRRIGVSYDLGTFTDTCRERGWLSAARVDKVESGSLHDDPSGLWWDSVDSNFGLAVHQQGGVLFAVVLQFDGLGKPVWYVAPEVRYDYGEDDDYVAYTGDLAVTEGTRLLDTSRFAVSGLRVRPAGSVELMVSADHYSYASYVAGNYRVEGNVTRITVQQPLIVGNFAAVRTTHPTGAGTATVADARMSITSTADAISVVLDEAGLRCEISGRLAWQGDSGVIEAANASCRDSAGVVTSGTFFAHEVRLTEQGFSMAYNFQARGETGSLVAIWIP